MSLPLEKQVVSLELAKRLKELGVAQDSAFRWALDAGNQWVLVSSRIGKVDPDQRLSAFTVAELGEMLPNGSESWRNEQRRYAAEFVLPGDPKNRGTLHFAATEADARAAMLIHLIEQGHLTIGSESKGEEKS
jgi:hypothetical protein